MMNRLLLGARHRRALKTMRAMVLPVVASLQKPGHSIPIDVLLDPFVLGYIRGYTLNAINQALDASLEDEKAIYANLLERFFVEIAGNRSAGREMVSALVNYHDFNNPDLQLGGKLAAQHWSVLNGIKIFDDDPDVVLAFQHASAALKVASAFGTNSDTPQRSAARFLHGRLLHYVSSKYGVENPDWRQWMTGW